MAEAYRDRFLSLLHNRPDGAAKASRKPRDRGFVILVPGNRSLEPLQALCADQTYNRCFTVRYRVAAGAVFGTVFSALARDLSNWPNDAERQGQFQPVPDPDLDLPSWRLLETLFPGRLLPGQPGMLPVANIAALLAQIGKLTDAAVGKRFVLFCEVVGDNADIEEWERARSTIFSSLPERVGLVFSGAPQDFDLIREIVEEATVKA